jgi:hypothetical protein
MLMPPRTPRCTAAQIWRWVKASAEVAADVARASPRTKAANGSRQCGRQNIGASTQQRPLGGRELISAALDELIGDDIQDARHLPGG